jgi:hypothetical protein
VGRIVVSVADTPELREECYRLAYDVFCVEMGTMRGEADHEHRVLRDPAIEAAAVFHAQVDGSCAGTMGILRGVDGRQFPESF